MLGLYVYIYINILRGAYVSLSLSLYIYIYKYILRTLTRHRRTSMLFCIWEAPVGCMVHCSSLRLGCAVCSHLLNVSPLTSLFTVGGPSSHIGICFLSNFSGFNVHFRSSWLAWAPLWTHPAPDLLKCRKLCEK